MDDQETVWDPARAPSEAAWSVTFVDIEDHDLCTKIANTLGVLIKYALSDLSFDLSRLEGTTVAVNYGQALNDLDRGFGASRPLEATSETFGEGAAMAAPVKRDGRAMMRLMLSATVALGLVSEDRGILIRSYQSVLHECAHIHDFAEKDRAFDGILLNAHAGDALQDCLQGISVSAWDEYFATHETAAICPASLDDFDQLLADALQPLLDRASAERRAFFNHRDFGHALREAATVVRSLFQMSGYVIGTADGLGRGDDMMAKSGALVAGSRFAPTYDELKIALRGMAKTYPEWTFPQAFDQLCNIAKSALEREGFLVSLRDDGVLWIQVAYPDDFTLAEVMRANLGLPLSADSQDT